MLEKGPQIRIIGNADQAKKDGKREEVVKNLTDNSLSLTKEALKTMTTYEYPKSPKEKIILNFANEITSTFLKEAGIEPYNIPAENFHMLPPEIYKEQAGGSSRGMSVIDKQGALLNAQYCRENLLLFAKTATHEMVHLKSHFALEMQKEEGKDDVKTNILRTGLSIFSSQKKYDKREGHGHFEGLNEAIVAEIDKRILKKELEIPELSEEKEWMLSPEVQERIESISKETNIPKEEVLWVDKEDNKKYIQFTYQLQRKVLKYVCEEIQKQLPEKYPTIDDVYKEFINANFNGKILEISRITDKTFGEGSFRILGNMMTDTNSPTLTLDTLKIARKKQQNNTRS